ncbi:MAG: hypothetical protein ACYTXC_01910 [Nostoc sp.]
MIFGNRIVIEVRRFESSDRIIDKTRLREFQILLIHVDGLGLCSRDF